MTIVPNTDLFYPNSITATGSSPFTDVVTVVAFTNLTGITGIRLETFGDGGPGRAGGNFVVTELTLDAVPEPTGASLALVTGLAFASRRRRSA